MGRTGIDDDRAPRGNIELKFIGAQRKKNVIWANTRYFVMYTMRIFIEEMRSNIKDSKFEISYHVPH